jgi:iron complex outermembrane receptor protein
MKWILFGCIFILFGNFCHAQTISGLVTDSDKNGIPDVNIVVSETGEGTITDKDGYFTIKNISQGKYTLKFLCLGYKTETKEMHIQKIANYDIKIVLKSDVYLTNEIIIEAKKDIEESALDIPVRSKTLSIQEITSAPAISTSKILEGISGVNVSSEAGIFSSTEVTMRGLGGNTKGGTLVVLDGSPINKSDAGSVNWSMIDKDNISSIEVIKGPGSVIFGSNAMGGIINIVSRKPSEKFSANISSSYGTYNTFDGKLRLSGINLNENVYWKSFFSYRHSDGYINTPDEIFLENDSIVVPVFLEEYMISGLMGLNLNDKNAVEFSVNYFDDTKGRGTKIYEFAGANTQRNTIHSFAKYRGQIKSIKLFVNIFTLFEDYFRLNEYYSDGEYALYEINSNRVENGAKFLSQYFISENIELTAGAEYKRGSVNGSDVYYTSTDLIRNRGNSNIYSGFAQTKIKIKGTRFKIVPGVRYDFAVFNNAAFSIENPSYSIEYLTEFQFEMSEPVHWSSFSPKLSLEYAFSDKNKLFATVAKGFRAPVLDDLCRSDQVKTGFRIANPKISAEYLYSFELGADFELFEGFYAGISGYYNIGKDFMYLLSTGDSVNMGYTIAPIYQTDNIGEVNIYGIETDLSYSYNKSISIFANHTWNNSIITEFVVNQDGAGVDLFGKFLTDIPDHKISGGIAFYNKIINFSTSANYIGKRWIKDDNTIETSYYLTDKYPSYTTFDAKLWRSYKNFDFSLTIDNLFDKIYTNSKGYKCPGRMIIFELKYNLKYNKDEN